MCQLLEHGRDFILFESEAFTEIASLQHVKTVINKIKITIIGSIYLHEQSSKVLGHHDL